MPYKPMSLQEAAQYLHMDQAELAKLVSRKKVPFSVVAGKYVFRKTKLHDWVTRNIIASSGSFSEKYHGKAAKFQGVLDRSTNFLSRFVSLKTMMASLQAKTKDSLLRDLAKAAADTNMVCDEDELFLLLKEREELCPTGLTNGVAIPHTRVHTEHVFWEPVLIIAKVPGGIPFGSVDGRLSDIFFMPCAGDDRSHLYMLARIAMMIQKVALDERMRQQNTPEDMLECFLESEKLFVKNFVNRGQ